MGSPGDTTLEALVRTAHLFFVAVAVGLPIYCATLDLLRSSGPEVRSAQRRMAVLATIGLVLGGLTGLFYGWLIWTPALGNALRAIGSRFTFGIVEYFFSLFLYVAYATTFASKKFTSRGRRILRGAIMFVAITNLAYHFPILLAVIHRVKQFGVVQPIDSSHFRQIAFSPPIVFGALHFLLSALVVGSLIAIFLTRRKIPSDRFLRGVALTSQLAVIGQWITGLIVYVGMPRTAQFELTADWGWGGLPQIIAIVWLLTLTLLALVVQPRSHRWLIASAVLVALLLIQMSWLATVAQSILPHP